MARIATRLKRGRDRIIDPEGRRRLTRNEKVGIGSIAVLLGVAAVGVIAGVILDRMLDFDDVLDAGGEWDEGGGVYTRWE
jgi:1-acyl-sn-glycerol-3-phosphate acyltransferase